MLHYGERKHRASHFLLKGALMLLIAGTAPALCQVPDPERMLYLSIGAIIFGWFFILAMGELARTTESVPDGFHQQRVVVHTLIILWVVLATWLFSTLLLTPEWSNRLLMLDLIAFVYPLVAIASHTRRHVRHMRQAKKVIVTEPSNASILKTLREHT